jgi:hypothetical protein
VTGSHQFEPSADGSAVCKHCGKWPDAAEHHVDGLPDVEATARELAAPPPEVLERVRASRALVLRELESSEDAEDQRAAEKLRANEALNDRELATVDAVLHGMGFLVADDEGRFRRVHPGRVRIIRWDGDDTLEDAA